MRVIMTALVFALLPAAALSAPTAFDEALAEQQMTGAPQGMASSREPATETLRGTIDRVDQGNDTIKLRLSADTIEQFKVQDGLIFDVVRYGDQVEVTVQKIAGAQTIVGLSKE